MKKSIYLKSVISGLGAILYALCYLLASVNLAIPYLLAVLSTMMVNNTAVSEILREYKKLHTSKGNAAIRKNFILLLSMLAINWIIIFIFIRVKSN